MNLKLRSLPASDDGLMIRVYPEFPTVDFVDEVSEGELDRHELPDVSAVALLLRTQGLAPETKRLPLPIYQLVQTGTKTDLGRIR